VKKKYAFSLAALLAASAMNAGVVYADEKVETPIATSAAAISTTGAPFVEGHKFVAPQNSFARPNTRESEKMAEILGTSAAIERGAKPIAAAGMPKGDNASTAKERGSDITPSFVASDLYRGLGSIFQYTNDGAPDRNRACGQAAVATILTYYSIKPRDTGYTVINDVYKRYGPDIAFGILGTSWQQVGRALTGYGVPFNWYTGEAGLKNALNLYKPCIVMLDVGTIPEEGWGWGGHWVVAYGYDRKNVYLTNWNGSDGGKCTWAAFNKAWNGQLAKANGTANMFMCPKG